MSGVSGGADAVAERVVAWQAVHGRNHLPWQQTRDPYRVWLSEIMLQQTQVTTVLDYYARFLDRFPDVGALAAAPQDEVLGLWSGLGYYSRARNLHRCAQQIMAEHGGVFPRTVAVLSSLPGIGRSTAGAIAAFCFSERAPILDANVRRVLTRLLGFDRDLASAKNERLLWGHAEALLPAGDLALAMPRYTQGLMDLGASLCNPRAPRCVDCPLAGHCVAFKDGDPERYPVRTRKLARRAESWQLVILRDVGGRIWLQRRPSTGIWAGMHCVPVFTDVESRDAFVGALGGPAQWVQQELPPFVHVLTHRDLHLHPLLIQTDEGGSPAQDGEWLSPDQWSSVGLPAPIRKLLDTTQSTLW
ncbi:MULTISPECIES: A/G-specific adenine glycosylase [unclassified Acidovorax]|uniref:A/G-specific adenine glycosylase n=1 Tax=unclassified Acidovorax TaxID=2684926 RepID=UPI0007014DE8|nr:MULTISPECIES: A/G-specific adenine glycosylase [unclassified Acidovorax]KRB35511.1 A/G-specific adenine glycosylase [Acidovorax sp. Root70]PUA99141.1 A/G-specific DNA-adenine glycosylase [Acidovorax sp. 107]